jgi:hypothetical protein
MFYLFSILGAFTLGVISGLLVYRKHTDRLKSTEDKGKSIIDALKGR